MEQQYLFSSENDYDIPTLLLEKQATMLPFPVLKWGVKKRSLWHPGTYHFYTSDHQFTGCWRYPDKIPACGCKAIIEVNYSINDETPKAVVLHKTYQKRYLARYWQTRGVDVIVDLNVPVLHQATNMLGVPQGWKSYATRMGAGAEMEETEFEYDQACQRAGTKNILFVIYGGGNAAYGYAKKINGIYIPDDMTRKTFLEEAKDGQRIE